MNLIDALERRAGRGPRRADVVIGFEAGPGGSQEPDRRTSLDPSPAVALARDRGGRRDSGYRVTAVALHRAGTDDHAPAATNPPSPPELSMSPEPPMWLTDEQVADAIASCAADATPTSAVVDGRASGVLVGLTLGDVWQSCRYPDPSPDYGPGIMLGTFSMPPFSGPLSLVPTTSAQWPISVIDAKAPDGNGVDGDEITWVWGRVDPSIATVTITTPTASFTPTLEDGLFAASWPGNEGDRTVVRGFDAAGVEVTFSDQLNCAARAYFETPDGPYTPMQPRVVVHGEYVGDGCIGGADVPPGQSSDDIGD